MRLMILNGPNLNLLGVREPYIYGTTTLAAIEASCRELANFAGAQLSFHQSNHEGVLIDLIHSARQDADAIIINPASYSFTSIAMIDAPAGHSKGRSSRSISPTLPPGTSCTDTRSSPPWRKR